MSERLHPDGRPVSATPVCDRNARYNSSSFDYGLPMHEAEHLERRAREAEARVAELEREVAVALNALRHISVAPEVTRSHADYATDVFDKLLNMRRVYEEVME